MSIDGAGDGHRLDQANLGRPVNRFAKRGNISCLNDSPEWADALASICEAHLSGWPTQEATDVSALAQSRAEAIALGAKV